ncbi:MAG: histidine phosphatase family protein [Rhizobiaceae bacterium]|nr:histidine phosphatase family protein [Rhizobiaceae bacterium]MCV0407041.1 histidine phosphatase family protein [Rhizobiaceae bacterium]
MGRLLLLRHAKAGWAEPGMRDFDRGLDGNGFQEATRMGAALREAGYVPDHAICSTARRARETWERVGRESGFSGRVTMAETLYSTDAAGYLGLIRGFEDARSLIVVGHNPMTEDVAFALANDGRAHDKLGQGFPTAGLAVIDFEGPWSDLSPGAGRLVAFLTPADL